MSEKINNIAGGDVENTSDLNNRKKAMVEKLNKETGSDHPLTEDGYAQAGRSQGIIDKLATTDEEKENLKNDFLSISRG
jgi:hypothetical protein